MRLRATIMSLCLCVLCVSGGACAESSADPVTHKAQIEQMYQSYRAKAYAAAPECSIAMAQRLIAHENPIILDVRSPAERAVSMIPQAIDSTAFQALGATQRPVIVYCTIGYRSGIETLSLVEQGYNAYNLQGGILLWIESGQALADDCKKVHVYGARWNYVPAGYHAQW